MDGKRRNQSWKRDCGTWVVGFSALALPGIASAATIATDWTFNDTLNDSSANGNTGTLTSGFPNYTSGQFGDAISLAAGVSVEDTAAAGLPTGQTDAFSINVWASFATAPTNGIYLGGFGTRNVEGDGDERALIEHNGHIYFWGNGYDLDTGVQYVADGGFHMYTVTYSGSTLTVYVDGASVASGTINFASGTISDVRVGGTDGFEGSGSNFGVDEFTVWNGALTPSEITHLYNVNAVPEPAMAGLFLAAGSATTCIRRRRR